MSFESAKKNWEGLAQRDTLWAICTHPNKQDQGWNKEEFYETGKEEISRVFEKLKADGLIPKDLQRAMDFGCGVGRLSRPLAGYFQEVYGVDVSPTMINHAIQFNEHDPDSDRLHFVLNTGDDLSLFENEFFSFIYTSIVLQHIPYPVSMNYIQEFMRVLKPGGKLVFQIPVKDVRKLNPVQKFKSWLKIRERLALMGIGKGFHMAMHVVNEEEIVSLINESGGIVLQRYTTNHTDPGFDGKIQFIQEDNSIHFVSRMFVVKK